MKKYFIELLGTFFLVLVIGLTGNPIAVGAMLMCMIYMGGHISGAHYNPAVTFAIFIRRKIGSADALMYILFQVLGALTAAFFYYVIKGSTFAPAPSTEATNMSALLIEILFTFALVLVILNVTTSRGTEGNGFYGVAIGFTVLAGSYAGGPVSGGAFNPAVGLGPIIIDAIFSGNSFTNLGLYIVGPFVGSLLAIIAYRSINPEEME
jgi:aquaporin Z